MGKIKEITDNLIYSNNLSRSDLEYLLVSTDEEEIDYLVQAVTDVVGYLRSISPFWRDLQTGKRPHVFAK